MPIVQKDRIICIVSHSRPGPALSAGAGGRPWLLFIRSLPVLIFAVLLPGCRSLPSLPPVSFDEAGWRVHRGQALWYGGRGQMAVAGELLVATRIGRETVVEFTKTPLPLVIARTTPEAWQVEFKSSRKSLAGRGEPPDRLVWARLGSCLFDGGSPPLRCARLDEDRWVLEHVDTGEKIEGYLLPGEYSAAPGETRDQIALALGLSAHSLEASNPGVDWTRIRPGTRLIVDPP